MCVEDIWARNASSANDNELTAVAMLANMKNHTHRPKSFDSYYDFSESVNPGLSGSAKRLLRVSEIVKRYFYVLYCNIHSKIS